MIPSELLDDLQVFLDGAVADWLIDRADVDAAVADRLRAAVSAVSDVAELVDEVAADGSIDADDAAQVVVAIADLVPLELILPGVLAQLVEEQAANVVVLIVNAVRELLAGRPAEVLAATADVKAAKAVRADLRGRSKRAANLRALADDLRVFDKDGDGNGA